MPPTFGGPGSGVTLPVLATALVVTAPRRLARRRLLLGRRNERPRHALCRRSSYDRSLIHLASRHGVDVALGNFAHARIERERLELELATRGLDLRFRRRASGSPGTTRSTGNAQASA